MTQPTDFLEQLAALAEKATPGPWETDSTDNGESGSERFNYYSIGAGTERWQTILDTAGSDVVCIEEEYDGDENGSWHHAWDEQGRVNCELIVLLRNSLPAILAMGGERDRYKAALERMASPRNIHFAGDAQVVARKALEGGSNERG